MDIDLEQLAAAALKLPSALRARLAERLIASLDNDAEQAAIAAEWEAELDRREAELEAYPESARPAAEVLRAARERLRNGA